MTKTNSRPRRVYSRNREASDTGNRHRSRVAGQFRRLDTLDRRRKDDHERSDEGPQGVETAPGSSSPEQRMECTTRRHFVSRRVSVSGKEYTKERIQRILQMMKNVGTTTENPLERVVEQIFNMSMPQILEEIVEIEAIVDIPVLKFEFIFLVNSSFFCCGMERCASFSVHNYFFFEFYFLINTFKSEIVVTFYLICCADLNSFIKNVVTYFDHFFAVAATHHAKS